MGGEKNIVRKASFDPQGSPPRGRGKASGRLTGANYARITPAWAGKSYHARYMVIIIRDHPRVGGEKTQNKMEVNALPGSPPRGRGKGPPPRYSGTCTGITPAWAGKSCNSSRLCFRCGDHPRVGGEKVLRIHPLQSSAGSPPRGRGKVVLYPICCSILWITPAWAGKRLKRSHRSGIFISGPIPFHSVLHRPAGSGGSRAGRDGSPAGQPQNAGPA